MISTMYIKMPYKLRKARGKDLYWVVDTTGDKYSKKPIPLERAKKQIVALHINTGHGRGGSMPDPLLDKAVELFDRGLDEEIVRRNIGLYMNNPTAQQIESIILQAREIIANRIEGQGKVHPTLHKQGQMYVIEHKGQILAEFATKQMALHELNRLNKSGVLDTRLEFTPVDDEGFDEEMAQITRGSGKRRLRGGMYSDLSDAEKAELSAQLRPIRIKALTRRDINEDDRLVLRTVLERIGEQEFKFYLENQRNAHILRRDYTDMIKQIKGTEPYNLETIYGTTVQLNNMLSPDFIMPTPSTTSHPPGFVDDEGFDEEMAQITRGSGKRRKLKGGMDPDNSADGVSMLDKFNMLNTTAHEDGLDIHIWKDLCAFYVIALKNPKIRELFKISLNHPHIIEELKEHNPTLVGIASIMNEFEVIIVSPTLHYADQESMALMSYFMSATPQVLEHSGVGHRKYGGVKKSGGNLSDMIRRAIRWIVSHNLHFYAAMVAGGAIQHYLASPGSQTVAELFHLPQWLLITGNIFHGISEGRKFVLAFEEEIRKQMAENPETLRDIGYRTLPEQTLPVGTESMIATDTVLPGTPMIDINRRARRFPDALTREEYDGMRSSGITTHPLTREKIVHTSEYPAKISGSGMPEDTPKPSWWTGSGIRGGVKCDVEEDIHVQRGLQGGITLEKLKLFESRFPEYFEGEFLTPDESLDFYRDIEPYLSIEDKLLLPKDFFDKTRKVDTKNLGKNHYTGSPKEKDELDKSNEDFMDIIMRPGQTEFPPIQPTIEELTNRTRFAPMRVRKQGGGLWSDDLQDESNAILNPFGIEVEIARANEQGDSPLRIVGGTQTQRTIIRRILREALNVFARFKNIHAVGKNAQLQKQVAKDAAIQRLHEYVNQSETLPEVDPSDPENVGGRKLAHIKKYLKGMGIRATKKNIKHALSACDAEGVVFD